jgi:pimeloyl-ACP methyl ester carboxylesterase
LPCGADFRNYLECHSLLVDLPDAGFSDKPTTASYDSASQLIVLQKWFTEIIKLSNVSLYSHSAGAFIALKLAAKIPSPPLRIILCISYLTDYGSLAA